MSRAEQSIVWVTLPKSSMQHQAQLLETRPDGYLVRWLIRKTTELISLNSTITKELPRRERKPSSARRRAIEQEQQNPTEDKKKQQKLYRGAEKSRPQSMEQIANTNNTSRNVRQKIGKGPQRAASNKENSHHSSPLSQPKPPPADVFEWIDESTGLAKPNLGYGHGEETEGEGETNESKSPEPRIAVTGNSLWKLHDLSRSTAEARLSQVLQPHGLSHASKLVANLFLFAYERQCCWQRRNNEAKLTWSASPIFQNYNLGNCYRELDRGTCFVRSEFCKRLIRHQHQNTKSDNPKPLRRTDWIQNLLWASFCYRQSNLIEPFLNFGGIPTVDEAKMFIGFVNKVEREEADKEDLFFTRLYSTPTFDEYRSNLNTLLAKNCWFLKSVAGRLAQLTTVSACWHQISTRLPGLSENTMKDVAWQILCDLLESGCLLCSSDDQDFCHFSAKSLRALSSQLPQEDPVDENAALKIAQTLVQRQDDIFAAIGVEFPKWDGRPLSLKNIEHLLTQYSRYLQIASDLRRQRSGGGNRLMDSRSCLDMSKDCRFCDLHTDEGLFCDACLCFYCGKCEKESCAAAPTNWICRPCIDLNQMEFLD